MSLLGALVVLGLLRSLGYWLVRVICCGGINVPTPKAEGLLGVRRAITRGGERPSYHWQTYVTAEGEKFFTAMIEAELSDFGHWELKR